MSGEHRLSARLTPVVPSCRHYSSVQRQQTGQAVLQPAVLPGLQAGLPQRKLQQSSGNYVITLNAVCGTNSQPITDASDVQAKLAYFSGQVGATINLTQSAPNSNRCAELFEPKQVKQLCLKVQKARS